MTSLDYNPTAYILEEYSESLKKDDIGYQSPDNKYDQVSEFQKTTTIEYLSPKNPLVAKPSPSVASTLDIHLVSSHVEDLLKSAEDALKRSQSSKAEDLQGSRGFEHSKLFSLAVSAEPSSAKTPNLAQPTEKTDEMFPTSSDIKINLNNQFLSVADPIPYKEANTFTEKATYDVPPSIASSISNITSSVSESKESYKYKEVYTYQTPATGTNYDLFPIRENPRGSVSSRSSGIHSKSATADRGMKDVRELKSGISSLEEKLNALANFGRGSSPNPPASSRNHLTSIRDELDLSGGDTPNFSLIAPVRARDASLYGPDFLKKSSFLDKEFSTSFTPKNHNTYNPTYNPTYSATPTSDGISQRVIKNIDDIMHRHLFNNAENLTKTTYTPQSRDQFTSPDRNNDLFTHTKSLYTSPVVSKFQVESDLPAYRASDQKTYQESSIQYTKSLYTNDFRYQPSSKFETNVHDDIHKNSDVFVTPPESHNGSPRASNVHESKPTFGSSNNRRSSKRSAKNYASELDLEKHSSNECPSNHDLPSPTDKKMKRLTLKPKHSEENERKDTLGSTPIKRDNHAGDLFSDHEISAHFDFNADLDNNGYLPEFRAGDLLSDNEVIQKRESRKPSTKQHEEINHYRSCELSSDGESIHRNDSHKFATKKAQADTFRSGDLLPDDDIVIIKQDDSISELKTSHKNSQRRKFGSFGLDDEIVEINKRSQAQTFRAGDLMDCDTKSEVAKIGKPPKSARHVSRPQNDNAANFRAGDLLSDRELSDRHEHRHDIFKSSDLMSDLEDVKRVSNNRKDDGKGWHMVHSVGSSIFENLENSFDFSHISKSKQNVEPQESSRSHLRESKAHIWVIKSPLEPRASNMSSSVRLSESVRKAEKTPILTHLFDKFRGV